MDNASGRQRISRHQPQELLPSDVALPRTPRQPFTPDPPRPMDHRGQAGIVAGDAEVGEVPLQHPAESTMLLSDRPRPHEAALLVDRLERAHQTICGGTLPHGRVAVPLLTPYVEKAQERKGRGPTGLHRKVSILYIGLPPLPGLPWRDHKIPTRDIATRPLYCDATAICARSATTNVSSGPVSSL